jgi:hypothetical protein
VKPASRARATSSARAASGSSGPTAIAVVPGTATRLVSRIRAAPRSSATTRATGSSARSQVSMVSAVGPRAARPAASPAAEEDCSPAWCAIACTRASSSGSADASTQNDPAGLVVRADRDAIRIAAAVLPEPAGPTNVTGPDPSASSIASSRRSRPSSAVRSSAVRGSGTFDHGSAISLAGSSR